MAGISELKDVVVLVASIIQSGAKALDDGKIDFSDIGYLMDIVQSAGPAFAGIEKVKAEFIDIDAQEKIELNQLVAEAIDLSDDMIETYIEKAFEVLFLVGDLINLRS